MKYKSVFAARLLIVPALILALVFGAAAEESYDAGTMRLLRYEGDVEILNPEGEPRFVLENVRFASGESMRTGEDGLASVGLDDDKIVTLDVLSRVNFEKEDSNLRMKLTEGTLLLDVQKKLDENETLDIETSTMVVGIRGTVVAVSDFPLDEGEQAAGPGSPEAPPKVEGPGDSGPGADQGGKVGSGGPESGQSGESVDGEKGPSAGEELKEILNTDVIGTVHGRVSTLIVLEGKVTLTYRSTDGVLHTTTVAAGEKAVLTDRLGSGAPDDTPAPETAYREDLGDFVLKQVENEPVLAGRVEKASGVLSLRNPDYDCPVTLVAASAQKSYDGAGFDGESLEVTAEGLPDGYRVVASASGTQTEVGGGESTVTEYTIYDSHGLNVTGRFRNLTTRNGALSVTWDDPVTLIAQSASRMYNGEPLQRTTDVLVNGLPSGYSIRVFADGSQTDAGKSPNPVSTWTIYNSRDEDVTEYFTAVETVDGWLVVDPAPMTVWTGSAEKVYDGTPLTCSDAVITSAPGYKQGQPRWRNLSYVVSETSPETGASSDCQTLYGICGVVRVHGTNPLTGETREIELHAGEKLLVYLHDADNKQTIEFKLEDVTEDGLPEGILRLFEDNPGLMRQSCADASWKTETVADLIEALPERTGEEKMVGQAGLKVAESEAERLMTDFTNVRITIDTDITDYTDRALGHDEAHYTPVYIEETIRVKATGSQTEPGESPNTYSITWGKAKKKNYTLSEKLGTLKVTELDEAAAKIVLTAASDEKTYDGKPLKNGGVVAEGLPEGYTVTAAASGSRTDAGTGVNTVTEYRILNAAGTDVTAGFTNVTLADGTLTVLPAKLTVVTGSASKVYDGEALTGDGASLEGLVNGETASVTATGSVTEPGETVNGYEITWGTAGSGNYTLEENLGTLKVEKLKLAVDLGGKSVDYSGSAAVPVPAMKYVNGAHAGEAVSSTRLRSMDVLYRFSLYTGDGAEVSISGMEAGAGKHTLVPGVTFTRGAEGRYEVASVTGVTMTVKPAVLTVTTGSAKKAYDGKPLTCAEITVEGLVSGETLEYAATGSRTAVGSSGNTFKLEWTGTAVESNYTVDGHPGTLEVTKNGTEIVITAGSGEKNYDGTELTVSGFTVGGLPEGFTCAASVGGSQTDAGSGASSVDSWTILDADGADVTDSFTGVTAKNGTLKVLPAGLTVTTGSAEKAYDGKPLTCGDITVEGLVSGETLTAAATGSRTAVGSSDNTFTLEWTGTAKESNYTVTGDTGTLEVTENGTEIVVTAASLEKTYDGAALTADGFTVDGLPEGFTCEASVSGSRTDAGSGASSVDSWTILDADGIDVSDSFTGVTTQNGTLKVLPAPLTVTTGTAKKTYDGTELTCADVTVEGLQNDETISVTTSGTITDAGETDNTCTIVWETANEDNYDVTVKYGKLTVNRAKLTITSGSDSKVYDGTALTCGTVTVTGLAAGETITATAGGTITDAGEAKNTISVEWGSVKKANYKVTKKQGTLTVEPLAIQINMDACAAYYADSGEELVYDGLPWTYWFTDDDWDGAYAVYTNGSASGTVLEPDELQVTYDDDGCGASQTAVYGLPGGGTVRVTLTGVTDAGSHRMIPGISLTAGKAGNYSFSWTDNTLNISPAPLYFDLNGQTTTFTNLTHLPRGVYATLYDDGEGGEICDRTVSKRIYQEGTRIPLCYFAEFELIGTDTVQLTCGGPVTVGNWNFKDFIEDISFTSGNPDNYDIRYTYGDVTVNPLNVNLYLADETETETVYDGQFHGPNPSIGGYYWMTPAETDDGTPTWDVTGNIKNETLFRAAISGGGTDAGDYTLTCEFSFPNAGEENFVFHVYNDTLHIEPAPLKITTASAEKVYDGEPLSGEAVVEGLQGSDTVTVTTASVTGAGETENTCEIEWGETNRDNYTLTQETGTLRVTPRDVEFDLGGRIMAWDGEFHGGDLFVYCEGLGFTVTKESDTVWTAAFDSGDTASVTITGGGINPDCYTLTCSYEFTAGSEDNFNIDCTFDELVISLDPSPSPRPLTIITGSAGKLYDGTPLTNPEVDIEGLRHRDSVTVTATGSQTEIGRSDNTYEIDWGDTDSSAYWLEDELGVLEVIGPDIPITVTTGSAGKAYDGTALTCGEAAVEGLPAGFTWTASACGSRTVAGSGANTLDSFAIFDMDGNDVTEVFTNVTVEEGTLTVTQNDAEIVVTAGSFNKEYSPLNTPTCDKYEITGLPEGFTPEVTIEGSQYTAGTSPNVITSFIIRNGDGEDVTENFSSITLVNGTLTITRAKIDVRSYGGSRGNTFTECDYTGGSHSWGISWSGVKGSDNPTVWDLEFTDEYGDGWVRDAGTHILSFTPVIVREDLLDKYEIGEVTFGTVTVHPAPLTVTTGSATKAYDGTPLTAGASLNGLLGSDTFQYKPKYIRPTVSATGSVTEAGSVVNGYEIDWGTVNPNNYTLIEDLGTLTVEPAPLTVITDSDTKPYDGTPLTAPGARLEGLAACDAASVIADGTITDPGSVTNSYVIDWGDTKPDNYRIVEHLGILSVTEEGGAAPLTVITESASKVYDGTPLTAGARLAGLSKDDNATVTATGSLTHAGSGVNGYEIDWGSTDSTKYSIIEDLGTLTVTKAALKVTTGSADKIYDGTPLTAGIVFEGLAGADDATASAFSGITNAGSAVNTYEIDWGSTDPNDYDITEDLGTLTVTKATLTVKTGSASMVYDGSPLTCDEAEISGLQNGETASVRATGAITEPGSVDNTYEITWGTANRDNYEIEEDLGWLTVYASGGPGHGGELLVSSVYGAKGGAETRTVSEPELQNVITGSQEPEDGNEGAVPAEHPSENAGTGSQEPEDGNEGDVPAEPISVKPAENETPVEKEDPGAGSAEEENSSGPEPPAQSGAGAAPASGAFTGSVKAVLLNKDGIFEGDTVAFRAVVKDGPPSAVILWQKLDGKEWKDVGTGEKLKLEASDANAGKYRVLLTGAGGTVLAEDEFRFPEIQKKETETSGTGNEPASGPAAEPEEEENANSGEGSGNGNPNESGQPPEQKDDPEKESEQPPEQKDEPNPEPAQPSGQKDDPEKEPAQPSGQKDDPEKKPAQPSGQKDDPEKESAQPPEQKDEPKTESAQLPEQKDEPKTEPAQPSGQKDEPKQEQSQPSGQKKETKQEPASPAAPKAPAAEEPAGEPETSGDAGTD